MRAFILALALAATPALAQPTMPGPVSSGPRPCMPMPECLVLIGPGGGDNQGPMSRGLPPPRPPQGPRATPAPGLPPPPAAERR